MSDTTSQALEHAAASPPRKDVYALIERQTPEIEKALNRLMDTERFKRVVFTELRRNPALLDCTPESLLGAMMLSAQLGLEPGPLGHVYLVPFKKQVTFMLGYRGIINLAYRDGALRDLIARAVYENEPYDCDLGRNTLTHKRLPPSERGSLDHYYGSARLRNGRILHEMWPEEIEARRKRSPAARAGTGPWQTDPEAMSLKTVVRAMQPWLPLSPLAERGLSYDERPIVGAQFDGDESEIVAEEET